MLRGLKPAGLLLWLAVCDMEWNCPTGDCASLGVYPPCALKLPAGLSRMRKILLRWSCLRTFSNSSPYRHLVFTTMCEFELAWQYTSI